MYHELTNLLPGDRSRALRREYFLRLGVVGLWVVGFLIVANGVLMAPTYMKLSEEVSVERERLALLANTLGASEEQEVGARLSRLAGDTEYLKQLANNPSGSEALRVILSAPHSGVAINRVAYSSGTPQNTLILSGVADTRDALRRYYSLLAALPYVAKADLPIGTYAKETELDFTITLTGTLTP